MKRVSFVCYLLIFMIFIAFSVFVEDSVLAAEPNDEKTVATDDFEEDWSAFDEDSDLESGFDDDTLVETSKLEQTGNELIENQVFQFGGFFKEDIGYSYEHEEGQPTCSKIRSTLNLSANIKLTDEWRAKTVWNGFYDYAYSNYGRDKFTDDTLDSYESESEIRDFFVDGAFTGWLRLKVGRQIIAWGESEVDQITDMANPRDNRELGIVDLEDARLPVLSTKVSLLFGSWETNLVAIHENRPNKAPAAGSEFDPLLESRGLFDIRDEEFPENKPENTEYLIRVFKSFNGGDIGIVWADVYNDSYHLDFERFQADIINRAYTLSVTPRHKRIRAIGVSANMVLGSWLFRTEMARKTGVAFARNQADLTEQIEEAMAVAGATFQTRFDRESKIIETWTEKDLLQGMLGFEYSGWDDLTFSLEGSLEKIEQYEANLSSKEISGSMTFHVGYSAMNDQFNADLYLFHLTDDNGDVYRINLDYDLIDALNLAGGFIVYEASEEEALVYPFRKNDRIFMALKYSF